VNQLTALTRIHDLGVEVRGVLTRRQISQIAGWRRRRADDAGRAAARAEAVALAREITDLAAQLRANQAAITEQVTGWTPWLIDAEHRGIGPVTGAQILIAYSHPGRVRTEAAFAKMAGTAPLPTGSGNSTGHRLSNRGDRDLNSAFWRIAHYRYHHDPNTAGFAHERRARGKSERAIVRKLKRYLTRSIWRELTHNLTPQHSPEPVTGQAAA
jgi:transposase